MQVHKSLPPAPAPHSPLLNTTAAIADDLGTLLERFSVDEHTKEALQRAVFSFLSRATDLRDLSVGVLSFINNFLVPFYSCLVFQCIFVPKLT